MPKDKTVYVYCDDGLRMNLACQQLTHLGFKNVKLYNGGWSLLGQLAGLTKGNRPYDAEFEL